MNITYGSVSLKVKDSSPAFHCKHPDGMVSIRATTIAGTDVMLYLDGTPEELLDWALKVRVAAHELQLQEESE